LLLSPPLLQLRISHTAQVIERNIACRRPLLSRIPSCQTSKTLANIRHQRMLNNMNITSLHLALVTSSITTNTVITPFNTSRRHVHHVGDHG